MCEICEDGNIINTTLADYKLKIYIENDLLNIKLGDTICSTRPLKINYCFVCGRNLKIKK